MYLFPDLKKKISNNNLIEKTFTCKIDVNLKPKSNILRVVLLLKLKEEANWIGNVTKIAFTLAMVGYNTSHMIRQPSSQILINL